MVRSFHQTWKETIVVFLVRKDANKFKVNTKMLFARIALLKDQLLIGKFVEPKSPPQTMRLRIQTLNQELRGCSLTFCRNVGKGFLLSGDDKDTLHNAMMLCPFISKWGTCMLRVGCQDSTLTIPTTLHSQLGLA